MLTLGRTKNNFHDASQNYQVIQNLSQVTNFVIIFIPEKIVILRSCPK